MLPVMVGVSALWYNCSSGTLPLEFPNFHRNIGYITAGRCVPHRCGGCGWAWRSWWGWTTLSGLSGLPCSAWCPKGRHLLPLVGEAGVSLPSTSGRGTTPSVGSSGNCLLDHWYRFCFCCGRKRGQVLLHYFGLSMQVGAKGWQVLLRLLFDNARLIVWLIQSIHLMEHGISIVSPSGTTLTPSERELWPFSCLLWMRSTCGTAPGKWKIYSAAKGRAAKGNPSQKTVLALNTDGGILPLKYHVLHWDGFSWERRSGPAIYGTTPWWSGF